MSTIKHILSFVAIAVASAIVSIAAGMAIIILTDNADAGVSVMVFGCIIMALALGAFDE